MWMILDLSVRSGIAPSEIERLGEYGIEVLSAYLMERKK